MGREPLRGPVPRLRLRLAAHDGGSDRDRRGTAGTLAWTPAAYISHITDNLRNWAERLAGARLAAAADVPGYDPDLIAKARCYNEIASAAALWSLQHAVAAWVESMTAALEDDVVLQHATRGIQCAEDVARNNAHDGYHHLWDIKRIVNRQTAGA